MKSRWGWTATLPGWVAAFSIGVLFGIAFDNLLIGLCFSPCFVPLFCPGSSGRGEA